MAALGHCFFHGGALLRFDERPPFGVGAPGQRIGAWVFAAEVAGVGAADVVGG